MNSDLLLYQDSTIKIDVRLEDETMWFTQEQMANLFGKAEQPLLNILAMFSKRVNFRRKWYVGISDTPILYMFLEKINLRKKA